MHSMDHRTPVRDSPEPDARDANANHRLVRSGHAPRKLITHSFLGTASQADAPRYVNGLEQNGFHDLDRLHLRTPVGNGGARFKWFRRVEIDPTVGEPALERMHSIHVAIARHVDSIPDHFAGSGG